MEYIDWRGTLRQTLAIATFCKISAHLPANVFLSVDKGVQAQLLANDLLVFPTLLAVLLQEGNPILYIKLAQVYIGVNPNTFLCLTKGELNMSCSTL